MFFMIDSPTPFDTLKAWQEFLQGLKQLTPEQQKQPEVARQIAAAEKHLAERAGES